MKKVTIMIAFLLWSLLLPGMVTALADDGQPEIQLDGAVVAAKGMIREGSLILPLRAVAESAGYQISWRPQERKVEIRTTDNTLAMDLQGNRLLAGDHESFLPYSPLFVANRIYLPADFFSDHLSLQTRWDREGNLVQMNRITANNIRIKTVKFATESKALKTTLYYPEVSGLADPQVQTAINDLFRSLAEGAEATGVQNAADLAPVLLQYPDMPGQCETYFDYQIKYNQKNRISVVFQNYQYAGGAHGSTVQTAYTLNLQNGQQFALQDLFRDGADYRSAISNVVRDQLAARDLTNALFQPFSQIRADQDYYLSNNGLVVFFQQYEILPYAAGIQEFTVDYQALHDLLRE